MCAYAERPSLSTTVLPDLVTSYYSPATQGQEQQTLSKHQGRRRSHYVGRTFSSNHQSSALRQEAYFLEENPI